MKERAWSAGLPSSAEKDQLIFLPFFRGLFWKCFYCSGMLIIPMLEDWLCTYGGSAEGIAGMCTAIEVGRVDLSLSEFSYDIIYTICNTGIK